MQAPHGTEINMRQACSKFIWVGTGDSGAEQTFTETQHRLLLKPLASTYPTPFGNQLVCLMWRAMMSYIRNPADVAGRLLLALGIGVLAGLAYFNSNTGARCSKALHVCIHALCVSLVYAALMHEARILLSVCTLDRVRW